MKAVGFAGIGRSHLGFESRLQWWHYDDVEID